MTIMNYRFFILVILYSISFIFYTTIFYGEFSNKCIAIGITLGTFATFLDMIETNTRKDK